MLLDSISSGPNHSAGVSVKKGIYTWGYPDGGRLGLSKAEAKRAKNEPMAVTYIMSVLQANKESLKEGGKDLDEFDFEDKNEEPAVTLYEQVAVP